MAESVCSVVALAFVLVACFELCGASTVVDVYRLIQYDISGTPIGSRLAGLNHHASSLSFPPGSDLSQSVLIVPLQELNVTFVRDAALFNSTYITRLFLWCEQFFIVITEYISKRQPLGGLLLLLPQIFSFKVEDGNGDVSAVDGEQDPCKKLLVEVEQFLTHANIPDDDMTAILADIKKNDIIGQPATAMTGGYKLVVSVSDPRKVTSPMITSIQGFSNVAEELQMKVGLKHKKINISNPTVAWEHEQFSRLRVTAATLSELSTTPELFEHTGDAGDMALISVRKPILLHFQRHIYGHKGNSIQIFANDSSLAVNPSYIKSWMTLLGQTPHVAPFLAKNDPFDMALKKEFAEHTEEVIAQNDMLDGMFTFYDSTKAHLNMYLVGSVTFDLLLLLVLGSYLIILFSFLAITTRCLDDLISLFRRPPSRKIKTA